MVQASLKRRWGFAMSGARICKKVKCTLWTSTMIHRRLGWGMKESREDKDKDEEVGDRRWLIPRSCSEAAKVWGWGELSCAPQPR